MSTIKYRGMGQIPLVENRYRNYFGLIYIYQILNLSIYVCLESCALYVPNFFLISTIIIDLAFGVQLNVFFYERKNTVTGLCHKCEKSSNLPCQIKFRKSMLSPNMIHRWNCKFLEKNSEKYRKEVKKMKFTKLQKNRNSQN